MFQINWIEKSYVSVKHKPYVKEWDVILEVGYHVRGLEL